MTDLIHGKVARILNSRELAINVGSREGVRIGMEFDVLDPKSQKIADPDSGEEIGSINRPKVRVRVGIVDDRVSIARTFRTTRVNLGGQGFDLNFIRRATQPPDWVTQEETLKTNESTWEDLDEEESFVNTGDPVVQVPAPMKSSE